MCKGSQEAIQEAERARMFKSVDQVSVWPTVLFLLCLIQLWDFDEVTGLSSFSVPILKPGLQITAAQICCEDVTGEEIFVVHAWFSGKLSQ